MAAPIEAATAAIKIQYQQKARKIAGLSQCGHATSTDIKWRPDGYIQVSGSGH
jgi:hypothetical protein